jgi:hypothetical protein
MAELTGLEPATSAVTGQRSKPTELQFQKIWWREQDSNLQPSGYEPDEMPLLYPAIYRRKSHINVFVKLNYLVRIL